MSPFSQKSIETSPSGRGTFGASIIENSLNFFDVQCLVFPEDVVGSVQPDTDEDGAAGPGLWFCFRRNLKQAGLEADDVIVACLSVIFQAEDGIGVSGRAAERAVHEGPGRLTRGRRWPVRGRKPRREVLL
jgi:hypothetical protein